MIELKNVNKIYQMGAMEVHALKDVNLTIEKGEMVCLGGPSGSGKSTLLNIIGAMDKASSGIVSIDNEDITEYSMGGLTGFRARKVGFIFQSFNLVPALNVYENIVVPMQLKGQRFEKEKVVSLIQRVGLGAHIKHRPDELSGGQRQRVAIARALVHDPPYIMADELTANLDSKTAQNIMELMKELNEKLGVTIIFASHDSWVLDAIDRKIQLRDGEIEAK